jgi:hypothetical protein
MMMLCAMVMLLMAAPSANAAWHRTGDNGCSAPQAGGLPGGSCTGSWPAYELYRGPSCDVCHDLVTRWNLVQVPRNTWIYEQPYPGTTQWLWVYVWGANPRWVAMRTDTWNLATYWSQRMQ